MHVRMPVKNPRKRTAEDTSAQKLNPTLSSAGDLLPAAQSVENVVEDEKVKSSLNRLQLKQEVGDVASIKLLICDSEALVLNEAFLVSAADTFGASSISLSEKQGLSIDRIVTVNGPLESCARCIVYLAFVLNSRVNNYARLEAYTLKLSNYCVDVLCEGIDEQKIALEAAQFLENTGLLLVTLRGDFTSLFSSLCTLYERYPYSRYANEESVELLPSVRVHDADFMWVRSEEEQKLLGGNKEAVLGYLFNKEREGDERKETA